MQRILGSPIPTSLAHNPWNTPNLICGSLFRKRKRKKEALKKYTPLSQVISSLEHSTIVNKSRPVTRSWTLPITHPHTLPTLVVYDAMGFGIKFRKRTSFQHPLLRCHQQGTFPVKGCCFFFAYIPFLLPSLSHTHYNRSSTFRGLCPYEFDLSTPGPRPTRPAPKESMMILMKFYDRTFFIRAREVNPWGRKLIKLASLTR